MSFHSDTYAYNLNSALPGDVLKGETDGESSSPAGGGLYEQYDRQSSITKRLNKPAASC